MPPPRFVASWLSTIWSTFVPEVFHGRMPHDRAFEGKQEMTTAIHARALLISLNISTWTARKYDRKVSDKVNSEYNASADAGRYNKFLLPGDAVAYKTLITLAGSIRAAHYSNTLAWSDEGWRLLPTANYMQYMQWYREQKRAFTSALADFVSDYPVLRHQAQSKLNGLYKPEDYPTDISARFALNVDVSPVPASGDLRVDLAADQVAAIEQSITDRVDAATRTAMGDAWKRLYDVVAKIADKCGTPDAIFRDSLIGNARDVCDTLRRLNVTNDADLEHMRARVERELVSRDPDELRDQPVVRQQTADRAAEIMRKMSSIYGVVAA
jgi:hypothetical protein